jgi:hypothetical protein
MKVAATNAETPFIDNSEVGDDEKIPLLTSPGAM